MGSYPNAPNLNYPPAPQSGYQPGYPPEYGNQNVGYPPAGYGPPGQYGPPQPQYGPPQGGYPPPPNAYSPRGPITNQPMGQGGVPGGGWMNMPQSVANCPPGLEYLTAIDQLLIHQKVERQQGSQTVNKYPIINSLGQKVYCAVEDSCCSEKNLFTPVLPFDMKILDSYENEIIHLHRPCRCDCCCCPCCLQSIEVSSPPGTVVGTVEQEWNVFRTTYAIKNGSGDTVLRIMGPFCTSTSMYIDVDFQVMSADGSTQVGKIFKQRSELMTNPDYSGITFPIDLDVRTKAVMLGALFLINVQFFDDSAPIK